MRNRLHVLADRMAALPDAELAAVLRRREDYTPEAVALAEEEADARGGLSHFLQPEPQPEPKPEPAPAPERPLHPEELLRQRFACAKCGARGARVRTIATTGFSKLLDLQTNHFIALSCTRCGYTELYDESVLKDHPDLVNLLDALFSVG